MIKIETSVVINRPSVEVFAYISNLEQSPVAVRLKERRKLRPGREQACDEQM